MALLGTAAEASRQQASAIPDSQAGDRAGNITGALVDPVDRAVLEAVARVGGLAEASGPEPLRVIPFSSERKLMAVFYGSGGGLRCSVKGAPRRILELSSRLATADGEITIDAACRAALVAVNDRLAAAGLRVLAVARGEVSAATEESLASLTFAGFIGLADPPAAGVKETIARLRAAGLRTVMLTGDQRLTAESVGRELGVLGADDRSLDGRELDALAATDRGAVIGRTQAFSRVTPEHKLIIVESLQSRGEIVAMLGDGINDAAALKKADVGVAMGGRGTDVAKEAAAIVLQDDRFETVAAAVEEGRDHLRQHPQVRLLSVQLQCGRGIGAARWRVSLGCRCRWRRSSCCG